MIAVVTCMYNRPHVSRIFCEGIQRLRDETTLDIQVFAAISETDSLAVCGEYGVKYIFATNTPLGAKWNTAFNFAMQSNPDAVLIMGDDDLISSEYLDDLINDFPPDLCCGLNRIAFLNCKTMEARDFKYQQKKTIGAGRFIPKWVLNKLKICQLLKRNNERISCNEFEKVVYNRDGVGFILDNMDYYAPYDPAISSSLDYSLELALAKERESISVYQSDRIHCVDLKTGKNIWGIDKFTDISKPCTVEDATWFLSDKEKEMIHNLK